VINIAKEANFPSLTDLEARAVHKVLLKQGIQEFAEAMKTIDPKGDTDFAGLVPLFSYIHKFSNSVFYLKKTFSIFTLYFR
jgi:hypothetical protein